MKSCNRLSIKHCTDLADFVLLGVVVDDGLREVVEGLETFHDRLLVVVDSSARLGALQQTSLHRFVLHLRTIDTARHMTPHPDVCTSRTGGMRVKPNRFKDSKPSDPKLHSDI